MKTVKNRLPYELYDVAGLEEWFAQMAAQGLHLASCGAERAAFERGDPTPGVRYRLEAQGYYENDPDKNRDYGEFGWEYVTTIRGMFYVFRTADPAAPELHTDPVVQSYTMKRLVRRKLRWLILLPLWYAWCMRSMVKLLLTSPAQVPMKLMLQDSSLAAIALILFYFVYSIVLGAQEFSILRRMKKRLAEGLPMDREKHYPRSFLRHGLPWLFALSFIPLLVFGFRHADHTTGLPHDPEDYPHVTLDQLLPGVEIRDELGDSFWNGSSLSRSTLVPVQFKFGDSGLVGSGSEQCTVRIYLQYYQTASPTTAHILLKGLAAEFEQELKHYTRQANYPPSYTSPCVIFNSGLTPLVHPAFDELYFLDYQYSHNKGMQRVYFGRTGVQVVKLVAALPKPEAALEAFAAQLDG